MTEFNQSNETVPEPPAPKIAIRTMESDIKSLETGGGEFSSPEPFIFQQKEMIAEKDKSRVELNLGNIPGYTGPEKPIFVSANPSISASEEKEEKIAEEKSPVVFTEPERGNDEISKNKIILTVIGIMAAAVALWIFGYFVVYPWFFPKEMPPVNPVRSSHGALNPVFAQLEVNFLTGFAKTKLHFASNGVN